MIKRILSVLPQDAAREIERISLSHARFFERLSEIRLRTPGASNVVLDGNNLLLQAQISKEELTDTVEKLTHGSLYAYRDAMAEGYLPFDEGVRVGIVGTARYVGGVLVGISEMRGLNFRIPHDTCDTLDALLSAWQGTKAGMLVYSAPGIDKTTALKALARTLGSGKQAKRVAVIDERFEFPPSFFRGTTVDILSGYQREKGLEIAVRTLSPEVIVLDEVGGEKEATGLLAFSKCGVPLLASAHAADMEEIRQKPTLAPFAALGVFDVYVGIRKENGTYAAVTFGDAS